MLIRFHGTFAEDILWVEKDSLRSLFMQVLVYGRFCAIHCHIIILQYLPFSLKKPILKVDKAKIFNKNK